MIFSVSAPEPPEGRFANAAIFRRAGVCQGTRREGDAGTFPRRDWGEVTTFPARQEYSARFAVAGTGGRPLLALHHGSGTVVRFAASAGATVDYVFLIVP